VSQEEHVCPINNLSSFVSIVILLW